ncbi:nuclear transport factor 2 family protein [Aliirhizobium smilacinae]|uniref:Nuclear transport factor 2 family protein n=1 Tax=Aliirhizobium smilacinae TaxID=1395944 RepID=A0A5C4XF10_9HYPH|nr:nuclear transport factor 2 family protein [Rhizobium smilacinae]TNM61441.1 nuclear transport factor 2 family protein [Rhizobium smilacinae]
MTNDIATLLKRNLQDVFGEADDARRQVVAAEIFTPDAEFHEPHGIYRGPEEIARIAGVIRASHPDFRYSELGPAEVLQETAGRVRWVSGAPGKPPAYAGTDFIIARDGRISAIYLFFDPLPGEGEVSQDKSNT